MISKLFIAVLAAIGAIAGNLISGWIQQDLWSNIFTPSRIIFSVFVSVLAIVLATIIDKYLNKDINASKSSSANTIGDINTSGDVYINQIVDSNVNTIKPLQTRTIIESLNPTHIANNSNSQTLDNSVLQLPQLKNGSLYLERFAIKAYLSRGGFSDIYVVWDEACNPPREVILKLARLEGQPKAVAHHLKREVELCQKLNTSINGLIRTFEARWLPDNLGVYLVQEYMPTARSLQDILYVQGVLEPQIAISVAIELCKTLEQLHNKKIAHCDVKPLNILILPSNKPILIDLGAARYFGERVKEDNIVISVPYSAPELLTGKPIDGKVDLYSLAHTLLHMLVGLPESIAKSRHRLSTSTEPLISARTEASVLNNASYEIDLDQVQIEIMSLRKVLYSALRRQNSQFIPTITKFRVELTNTLEEIKNFQ